MSTRDLSQFQDFPKTVDYTKFKSNFRNIVKNLQTLGNKCPEKKRTILATCSSDNYDKLNEKKSSHSLFDCQDCFRSASLENVLSILKSVSNSRKLKTKKNGLVDSMVLVDRTTIMLNDLMKEYRVNYKTTFTKEV